MKDVPACNALDSVPKLRATDATNGALSETAAQMVVDAKLRFEGWYNWAANSGEPSLFIDGILADGTLLSPDEVQAVDHGGHDLPSNCDFPVKAVVVVSPTTPKMFGVVSIYAGPCSNVVAFADGRMKTIGGIAAGGTNLTYDEGSVMSDPVLGPYLHVTNHYECNGATGAIAQACAQGSS